MPPTAGEGVKPGGEAPDHNSPCGTGLPLSMRVPGFGWGSAKGVAVMGWQTEVLLLKQLSGGVAWTPPMHGPNVPISVHFSLPSKHPGTPWNDGSPLKQAWT